MFYDYELYKDYISNLLANQFIPNCLIGLFGCLLTYKTYSPLASLIQISILNLVFYFIHVELHKLPKIVNVHMNCHHNYEDNKNNINRMCNLQKIINYFFYELFNITLPPEILVFYYGFIYVSTHIINYSIFHAAKEHVIHHESTENPNSKTYNYGPDLADHIFGTNSDNTFENNHHIIPNILISFLISYYVFRPALF